MEYKCEECGYKWNRIEAGRARYCQRCGSDRIAQIGLIGEAWRTIKLGLHKSVDEYHRALHAAGFYINSWADDILGRVTFSVAEREVNLVVRSVAELGFANGATFAQICDAAKKLGLSLCPAEVGPAFREQYCDQPMYEWLIIAMEPISASDGSLRVFYVARIGDGLWLGNSYGSPRVVWNAGNRFVFASSR